MSNVEWRKLDGFSKYLVSSEGEIKRIAYMEDSGRFMKEVSVKPYRSGDKAVDVAVRLLTDDKREVFRSLNLIINSVFPELSKDRCKELAEARYTLAQIDEALEFPGEVWKDCARYENILEVSTFGRLRRKYRVLYRSNGRKYTVKPKILKQSNEGRDYKCIMICLSDDTSKYEAVHRLVAETFIPNPDNLPEVNHMDGNGGNNFVENLEWSSHKDNSRHAWDTGLYKKPHPVTCLDTGEEFDSAYALAKLLNLNAYYVQSRITCKSPIMGKYYQYTEKLCV